MAIKISQGLKQTQSLVMTPQLQQAIKLLTLTHLEMTNVICEELVENPMLEELDNESEIDKDSDYKLEKMEMQNKEATNDKFDGPDVVEKDEFDWNKYIESYNSNSSSPPSMATPDSEEMPNYENIVSRGNSLAEHLVWQLRMESFMEDEMMLAEDIIHNINDDGYLAANFEDIIADSKIDREDAYEILDMIKKLDPVGCGATSLADCLLAQAKVFEERVPLVEKIITDYLEDLHKKDYVKITKEVGASEEAIKNAEMIIHSLNPKPGRLISAEETQYIVPDIYVKSVGGQLEVQINDDGVPRLRISNLYKSMINSKDDNTREFIQEKLRSALWLIKSIQNRQKTIVKVAEAILRYQPEFFRKGPEFLKPMILKNIANEIGVHESTVSRVTTNKYMHTPLGTYELKYFFNTGIGGKDGGIDIASESLKLKIKCLIENESKKKPLSDQKIVDLLKTDGIVVARRTIAKYREMMNILPSSKRKQKKV